jgi:hypothetical protein
VTSTPTPKCLLEFAQVAHDCIPARDQTLQLRDQALHMPAVLTVLQTVFSSVFLALPPPKPQIFACILPCTIFYGHGHQEQHILIFHKSNFFHLNCCHTPRCLSLSIQCAVSRFLLYVVLLGCFHSPRPLIVHRLRPYSTFRNATILILCIASLALISKSFLPHRRLRPSVSPAGTVFE